MTALGHIEAEIWRSILRLENTFALWDEEGDTGACVSAGATRSLRSAGDSGERFFAPELADGHRVDGGKRQIFFPVRVYSIAGVRENSV